MSSASLPEVKIQITPAVWAVALGQNLSEGDEAVVMPSLKPARVVRFAELPCARDPVNPRGQAVMEEVEKLVRATLF